ncbi:hypothetical protein LJC20_06995, partial [Eubacteriales bacterium OttesenSCG-928-M02]|nr:hypothetical protein [Eubacteriales bacterium OttesenSCG-928-M02]
GDLNDWHWKEEVPPEEAATYTRHYIRELDTITRDVKHLDLLLFPLDPRLGQDCGDGVIRFLSLVDVACFAPMHFADDYKVQDAFKKRYNLGATRMVHWSHRGQTEVF